MDYVQFFKLIVLCFFPSYAEESIGKQLNDEENTKE